MGIIPGIYDPSSSKKLLLSLDPSVNDFGKNNVRQCSPLTSQKNAACDEDEVRIFLAGPCSLVRSSDGSYHSLYDNERVSILVKLSTKIGSQR